jgi:hypothetical protein
MGPGRFGAPGLFLWTMPGGGAARVNYFHQGAGWWRRPKGAWGGRFSPLVRASGH